MVLVDFFTNDIIGNQLKKIIAEALPQQSPDNKFLCKLSKDLTDSLFGSKSDRLSLDSGIRRILNSKIDSYLPFFH
ncbi:MAG: hypothetical protein ACKO3R_02650 [bacterium]